MFRAARRVPAIALLAAVAVLPSTGCTAPVHAPRPVVTGVPTEPHLAPASDAQVITEWSRIAQRTITDSDTPAPVSALYSAFVSLAMYDAVVAVQGGYEQYIERDRDFGPASPQAAAATAASVLLRHYFPDSAEQLRAEFRRTLAGVPRDRAFASGVRAGIAASAAMLVRRLGDGRDDTDRTPELPHEPGVWRPTVPNAEFAVPWRGFVRPLALDSATQFGIPQPNALGSDAYARDFAEVKSLGAARGAGRTGAQTHNALFFSADPIAQYRAGLRDLVARHELNIVDSARAVALLDTAMADALIVCWRAKFDHPTWRPITAIRLAATDGDSRTDADTDWTPLGTTPSSPDFVSEHACVTGAASEVLSSLFGADSIDLTLTSARHGSARPLEHHYDSAAALDADAVDGQVCSGLEFRSSAESAVRLGHNVADWTASHFFRPVLEETTPPVKNA